MSAFMVNNNVMAKVVTAILLNLDTFDTESTRRVALLATPTDAQKDTGTKIGRKLFLMNRRALGAQYECSSRFSLPQFVFAKWADDGSLWQAFIASVAHLAAEKQLDLRVLHGDGTNTVAKKGGMALGIRGTNTRRARKSARSSSIMGMS